MFSWCHYSPCILQERRDQMRQALAPHKTNEKMGVQNTMKLVGLSNSFLLREEGFKIYLEWPLRQMAVSQNFV